MTSGGSARKPAGKKAAAAKADPFRGLRPLQVQGPVERLIRAAVDFDRPISCPLTGQDRLVDRVDDDGVRYVKGRGFGRLYWYSIEKLVAQDLPHDSWVPAADLGGPKDALTGLALALLIQARLVDVDDGPPLRIRRIAPRHLLGEANPAQATAEVVWEAPSDLRNVMCADHGLAVIQDREHRAWGLDVATGAALWGPHELRVSSPQARWAVTPDRRAVVVDGDELVCLAPNSSEVDWRREQQDASLAVAAGALVVSCTETVSALEATTGKVLWQLPVAHAVTVVHEGRVAVAGFRDDRTWVGLVDTASGAVSHEWRPRKGLAATWLHYDEHGMVVTLARKAPRAPDEVVVLDGELRPVAEFEASYPTPADKAVVVSPTGHKGVAAVDRISGKPLWRLEATWPRVLHGVVIIEVELDPFEWVSWTAGFDPLTGDQLWARYGRSPFELRDHVCLTDQTSSFMVEPRTGVPVPFDAEHNFVWAWTEIRDPVVVERSDYDDPQPAGRARIDLRPIGVRLHLPR